MHDLLKVSDLSSEELDDLLDLAARWKKDPTAFARSAAGKVVGVLFEKPSLRTRFSIEAALARIGAYPIGAYDREVGLGTREPMNDAGAVLAGYCDALVLRTFEHSRVDALAAASDVPVVNALSDEHHPLQALADVLTLRETFGDVSGLRLAYLGDGNNVCNSLIEAGHLTGIEVVAACPPGREPSLQTQLFANAADAVRGAHAVYADVWVSMGDSVADPEGLFSPFRVTSELMSLAHPDAIFLHCLPAHRGEEVTAQVMDGPASRVIQQAANRMHTAAAVFLKLLS